MEEAKTKICSRCGKEKALDEFYTVTYKTGKTKYRYGMCKTCYSIEQRRRYLMQNDPDNPLLSKIEELYDKHRAAGRSVPDSPRRSRSEIEAEVDALLAEEDE